MESIIQEITKELLLEKPNAPIPAEKVRQWMKSDDIEVWGAIFALLHDPDHYCRIDPPFSFEDNRPFHLHFYERCIRENPDGEWSYTRYLAAHSLVAWFNGLWKDSQIPRSALNELKSLLEKLYREGDEEIRCCIITGALEHLFVHRKILKFFENWKSDAILSSAYNEALGYSKELRGKKGGDV